MRTDGGAACDGSGDTSEVEGAEFADAGHGGDDACCHGHSHGSGTHRDTHQSSHDEGHQNQRQAGVCHGVADDITQTGVLQHVAQHAAAGSDQQDHAGGLQRLGHDLFQLGVGVAVTGAQQVHSSDGSQQQSHEGLAEEGQNGLDASQSGYHLCHRVCNDEDQRDQDDAHDGAKLGQLALVNVCLLCNVLGDFNHVLFAADAAPDGTGGDHGKDAAEDERLKTELLGDEKERAEHNMLVDLGRNDLGKVSKYGSVEVEDYMAVLQYSHVMHIGSTVRGEIRDDKDSLDAVDAVLPAGTLSGAPKIRAMEIINELENNKRGIYGGAIGYVDFTGNLDTCIAIRTVFKKNDKIFVRSGAGIVADSVPENEYHECINKAKAVMDAVDKAQGLA